MQQLSAFNLRHWKLLEDSPYSNRVLSFKPPERKHRLHQRKFWQGKCFFIFYFEVFVYLCLPVYEHLQDHHSLSVFNNRSSNIDSSETWDWIFKRLNTLSILASKPQLCNDILFFIPSFQFPPFSNLVNVNIWRPVFLLVFNGLFLGFFSCWMRTVFWI